MMKLQTEQWKLGKEVALKSVFRVEYIPILMAILTWIFVGQSKRKVPDIHIHAFSPLEIHHGAMTLG